MTWNDRPDWLRNARRLWGEDDGGAGDRERLPEAWRRLFDEPLPGRNAAVDYFDNGDEGFALYAGGRIMRYGFDGDAIYVAEAPR